MPNGYGATSLIGGGVGSLDKIDGSLLLDGDVCTVITDSGVYHYHLDATSGASEDSPYVISPDTNPGTKRWLLVTPQAPFSAVSVTESTGQSILNNTNTKIVFNSGSSDTLAEFNTTTGVFTATYTGRYSINSTVYFPSAAYTDLRLFLYKNTSTLLRRSVQFSSGVNAISLTAVVDLAATNTLEINVIQVSGASRAIQTGNDRNWLTIDRIA